MTLGTWHSHIWHLISDTVSHIYDMSTHTHYHGDVWVGKCSWIWFSAHLNDTLYMISSYIISSYTMSSYVISSYTISSYLKSSYMTLGQRLSWERFLDDGSPHTFMTPCTWYLHKWYLHIYDTLSDAPYIWRRFTHISLGQRLIREIFQGMGLHTTLCFARLHYTLSHTPCIWPLLTHISLGQRLSREIFSGYGSPYHSMFRSAATSIDRRPDSLDITVLDDNAMRLLVSTWCIRIYSYMYIHTCV